MEYHHHQQHAMNKDNNNKEHTQQHSCPDKLSLQEAFEVNRYDVISRSRQRQKEIQLRSEQRQREQEYEIERLAELQKQLEISSQNHVTQRYIDLNKNNLKSKTHAKPIMQVARNGGTYFEVNIENFGNKRGAMSSQEIKSQTRKNYSKLPEVKQKQLNQRAEETKRRNRLKSDIYKKVYYMYFINIIGVEIQLNNFICLTFENFVEHLK